MSFHQEVGCPQLRSLKAGLIVLVCLWATTCSSETTTTSSTTSSPASKESPSPKPVATARQGSLFGSSSFPYSFYGGSSSSSSSGNSLLSLLRPNVQPGGRRNSLSSRLRNLMSAIFFRRETTSPTNSLYQGAASQQYPFYRPFNTGYNPLGSSGTGYGFGTSGTGYNPASVYFPQAAASSNSYYPSYPASSGTGGGYAASTLTQPLAAQSPYGTGYGSSYGSNYGSSGYGSSYGSSYPLANAYSSALTSGLSGYPSTGLGSAASSYGTSYQRSSQSSFKPVSGYQASGSQQSPSYTSRQSTYTAEQQQ